MIKNIKIEGTTYAAQQLAIDHTNNVFRWKNPDEHIDFMLYVLFPDDIKSISYVCMEDGDSYIHKRPAFWSHDECAKYEGMMIDLYRQFGSWREVFECISV